MVGNTYKNSLIAIMLTILVLVSPATGTTESKWVAVLVSDSEKIYEMPIRSFSDAVGVAVRYFNLEGDIRKGATLKRLIAEDPPAAVYALGAKAAYVAKLWTRHNQEIPVIFSMVLNWQKYGLLGDQKNIAGISSEVNPGSQFLNLGMFAPEAKKIGVIYSKAHSLEIVLQARRAAERLGITLVEEEVAASSDLKRKYRRLVNNIDALWILQDPVTYTLENVEWLQKRCIRDRLICIGQSRNLTQLGVLLSVRPDITNIGVQAASLTRNIIVRGQKPSTIGVMEPLGTRIYLNKRTAELIRFPLRPQAVEMVTELIE